MPQREAQSSEPESPWGIREVCLEEVRTEMGLEGWTRIDWLEALEKRGNLELQKAPGLYGQEATGQLRPLNCGTTAKMVTYTFDSNTQQEIDR